MNTERTEACLVPPSRDGAPPAKVAIRDVAGEPRPPGGGTEVFDGADAREINEARLGHLESLALPLDGRSVLDVGCGVGHLAQFFVARGCAVTCVDARAENVRGLRARYPDLHGRALNVETTPLAPLGAFNIVFAYGLLYHLENPMAALRNMATVCTDLLLLETIICDSPRPVLGLEDETTSVNQGLHGLGCRPSPSYVTLALNRVGFAHVYAPRRPPEYPDYHFEWLGNLDWQRHGANLRCVFVAARRPVVTDELIELTGAA